jgi:uncharacterized protein GlcG (DUF336 family)
MPGANRNRRFTPSLEPLEQRFAPAVTASANAGLLDVKGDAADTILVAHIGANFAVLDNGVLIASISEDVVQRVRVTAGPLTTAIDVTGVDVRTEVIGSPGNDLILAGDGNTTIIDGGGGNDAILGGTQKSFIAGGNGNDTILARGPSVMLAGKGDNNLLGGADRDRLYADGGGANALSGGAGVNRYFGGEGPTTVTLGPDDDALNAIPPPEPTDFPLDSFMSEAVESTEVATAAEVEQLLDRAAAASASNDGIFAIVDRTGRILGVRVESGVDPAILADPALLSFAIDGALAKARTGAFFANNAAPLNSRTVQFISQSTKTEREIESNPNDPNPASPFRGPGFVAPIGIGGHFPPVSFTPSANLFDIEHTNRDRLGGVSAGGVVSAHAGADGIAGTADDPALGAVGRFNVALADYVPGKVLEAPISFGEYSGLNPNGQSRGIGTLPGGIPLYKNGQVVGGIGVFFPGKTGFANEENSILSADFDPTKADRSLEAEWIAFAAAGGASGALDGNGQSAAVGVLSGVAPVAGYDLIFDPNGILVDGIRVPIFGPLVGGVPELVRVGDTLGRGNPADAAAVALPAIRAGVAPPNGWIVGPKDAADGSITADQVKTIIAEGVQQAANTRAAIRIFNPPGALNANPATAMVFAVSDNAGNVIGLYRMPDATFFSVDVAVAKSRNVTYYSRPTGVNAPDQVNRVGGLSEIPAGTSATNRTFRYLALPFFPSGIDYEGPGAFSTINDGGVDPKTGLQVGAPLPANAFQSVAGFDAFVPGSNFRDERVATGNTNGIVFFPGSTALYQDADQVGFRRLVAGFGVSGDGVDQDDVVTQAGALGFLPDPLIRADRIFVDEIRLPYAKFPRNPEDRG